VERLRAARCSRAAGGRLAGGAGNRLTASWRSTRFVPTRSPHRQDERGALLRPPRAESVVREGDRLVDGASTTVSRPESAAARPERRPRVPRRAPERCRTRRGRRTRPSRPNPRFYRSWVRARPTRAALSPVDSSATTVAG
jgi:hypothetical protein